ncbi:MAG: acyl-CoA dehydrogenase [Acidimicrobiia bacterium]|nr:MAG: acyl-CoA dehydrogenase [Acidimicrobiia bacterium]
MDFSLTEAQQELQGLAGRILADRMTLAHLKERDRSEDWYDLATWAELAKANVCGIAIPESAGGLGLGFLDLCLVLREVGRHVAPLPAVPTLVGGALPLARYGTEAQQAVLPRVAAGEALLTAALVELGADPERPRTTAVRDGAGWRIDGVKSNVPAMHCAESVLVPATVGDDVAVFVVPCGAGGVTAARQQTMNHEPLFEVRFDGVRVGDDALVGSVATGHEVLRFVLDRVTVATCAVVSGVADQAVRLTARYTCDRKQFDRPIGTFQAVGQRMADCFIDDQAIELTMLQAATHLDEGLDVPLEVATAKFWACDGGHRIGHAALHVHGGISIDLDFPIHRYFLWLKQAEFTLGAATPQLRRIGRVLAEQPAPA